MTAFVDEHRERDGRHDVAEHRDRIGREQGAELPTASASR
jgi:hypothetical protein